MVDSTPTLHAPPSITPSMRPCNCCHTASAEVGLIFPNKLALGAAKGKPLSAIMRRAKSWSGQRTATVGNPALIKSEMLFFLGKTTDNGPGQNLSINFWALAGTNSATNSTCSAWDKCTIRGSKKGRFLAAKISAMALGISARAAKPYTVSVGIATTPPPRKISIPRGREIMPWGESFISL